MTPYFKHERYHNYETTTNYAVDNNDGRTHIQSWSYTHPKHGIRKPLPARLDHHHARRRRTDQVSNTTSICMLKENKPTNNTQAHFTNTQCTHTTHYNTPYQLNIITTAPEEDGRGKHVIHTSITLLSQTYSRTTR